MNERKNLFLLNFEKNDYFLYHSTEKQNDAIFPHPCAPGPEPISPREKIVI